MNATPTTLAYRGIGGQAVSKKKTVPDTFSSITRRRGFGVGNDFVQDRSASFRQCHPPLFLYWTLEFWKFKDIVDEPISKFSIALADGTLAKRTHLVGVIA